MTLPAAELCHWQISIDNRYVASAAINRYRTSLSRSCRSTGQTDGQTQYHYTDVHRQKRAALIIDLPSVVRSSRKTSSSSVACVIACSMRGVGLVSTSLRMSTTLISAQRLTAVSVILRQHGRKQTRSTNNNRDLSGNGRHTDMIALIDIV